MPTTWDRARNSSSSKGTSPQWWYTIYGTAEHGLPAPPTPSISQMGLGTDTRHISDMVTKNFHSRIQAGEIINNPLYQTRTETFYDTPGPLYLKWSDSRSAYKIWCATHGTYHNRVSVTEGSWRHSPISWLETLSGGVTDSAMRQSVIDLAVTSANANIDTSEMLALATIAESRKSVESMLAISKQAMKTFRNVRKLNIRALKKDFSLAELSDRYMEARYAIRPLVYDAFNLAAALQKERGYERKTFRGYAEDSNTNADTLTGTSSPVADDWIRTIQTKYSARAGVLCDVSITDLSVYGGEQLAETMWELVPFSFIADWFANTGDWIAAHTPNAGVTQRASWVTVRKDTVKTQTVSNCRWNLVSGQTGITLTRKRTVHRMEEMVLERLVNPAISTWPSSKLNLDVYKLTDIGIILRGVFSR